MEEPVQYSRQLLIENLNRLNSCTNNDERVMIEHLLLSMSQNPQYMTDTFDIIANDPVENNKQSTVLFFKTMIRNNFSNNIANADEKMSTLTAIVKVLAESNISIKIKVQLGNCLKTGLIKVIGSKAKEQKEVEIQMEQIKQGFMNNPSKIQYIGLQIAIKNIVGSQNNIVLIGNFYKNYIDPY